MKTLTNNLLFKTSVWATTGFLLVKIIIIMIIATHLAGCSKAVYCSLDKMATACIDKVTNSVSNKPIKKTPRS